MRYILVCALLFVFSGSIQARTCNDTPTFRQVTLNEEALLISVLRLNGRPLFDGIDIATVGNTHLVPVSGLVSSLNLPWQVSNSEQRIVSAYNDTKLELCDFDIQLQGAQTEGQFLWAQDTFDIYIDVNAIEVLLNVKHDYNYELLQLNLHSDNPALEPKGGELSFIPTFETLPEKESGRVISDQYSAITLPILNYRVVSQTHSEQGSRSSASVNGAFDLFNHAASLRVNTSESGTQQLLKLSRNTDFLISPSASDPLRYEFGDIQLQGDELINRAKQAMGVALYSHDPFKSQSFSSATIEEFVLPGWRVQLFRNGQFITEVFSDDSNRVLFADVETFYGDNFFEIKLYGPEGQQETRTQLVKVGTNQLKQGRLSYYVGATDASQRFIDSSVETPQGFYKNATTRIAYGLTNRLTLSGSYHSLAGDDERADYLSSALTFQFPNSVLKAEVANQTNGGEAYFLGLNSRIGNDLRFNLSGQIIDDFVSEAFTHSMSIEQQWRARLNGRTSWLGGAGWNLSITHRSVADQSDSNVFSASLNKNLLGGTFSGSIEHRTGVTEPALKSRVYYSKAMSGWRLTSSLEWYPADNQRIEQFYTTLRWPQKFNSYNETRIQHRPNADIKTEIQHQYNWRLDVFNLALGARYNSANQWGINLTLSGDIDYDPTRRQLNFYRPRGMTAANIEAFVFLDNNRNAVFDEHDQSLADVAIDGSLAWRDQNTDEKGKVRLATTRRQQPLSIATASLPDPYMHPVDQVVQVNTHTGGFNSVALPVVTFNDIEGAVYQIRNGESRGAGGLKVNILDVQGEIVAQTLTESDGFFYLSKIPPGQYDIQIDPDYLAANNLTIGNQPDLINAPREGDSIRIQDVLITDLIHQAAVSEPRQQQEHFEQEYFVQLGAFKKSRSIPEVIKYLDIEDFNIRIFRHHLKGLSYVTLGDFEDMQQAQKALQRIVKLRGFEGAYIVPAQRYFGTSWHEEFVLKDIQTMVVRSHTRILKDPDNAMYCQLGAFRSLTSLRPDAVSVNANTLLLRRAVNETRYYTLVKKPDSQDPAACQSMLSGRRDNQRAFAVGARVLKKQLLSY